MPTSITRSAGSTRAPAVAAAFTATRTPPSPGRCQPSLARSMPRCGTTSRRVGHVPSHIIRYAIYAERRVMFISLCVMLASILSRNRLLSSASPKPITTTSPTNPPTMTTRMPTSRPTQPPTTPRPTTIPTPLPTTPRPTSVPTPLPTEKAPTSIPMPPPAHFTSAPTSSPTSPMMSVEVLILTDDYPGETTWTLVNQCGQQTTMNGGPYNKKRTWVSVKSLVPSGSYLFTINDVWADGLCCGYGPGSYKILVDGIVKHTSNGKFTRSQSQAFGSCALGQSAAIETGHVISRRKKGIFED